MHVPTLPTIAELAQPELRLAGLRINPRTNGRSRRSYYTKLVLLRVEDRQQHEVTGLPESARITNVAWSPDGRHIAFAVTNDEGTALWAAPVATGLARRLTAYHINRVYGRTHSWLSDNRTLICRVIPEERGSAPKARLVPNGPVIQENLGKKAPARTYQDLLKNRHDEDLFEHYLTAQCVLVTLNGETETFGRPGMIRRASPSPDGQYILVETIQRPFSYIVPLNRFPTRIEV